MIFKVVQYDATVEKTWDHFVLMESINGTFLQTRAFLNYHPSQRFTDVSLLILDEKDTIAAVCPACEVMAAGKKILYSHKGSSFGGIIVRKKYYKAAKLLAILQVFERFVAGQWDQCVLKITPDIFAAAESALLEYALTYCGYSQYADLSSYIDLQHDAKFIDQGLSENKKRSLACCKSRRLTFSELKTPAEIEDFYRLLQLTLSKFNLAPVHTVQELLFFKMHFQRYIQFWGVYEAKTMAAAGMTFVFQNENSRVLHTQYLAADICIKDYSPSTYLYYAMIETALAQRCQALSWGVSTEAQGKILNKGLIQNKEQYGSKYALNRVFCKIYR